MIKNYRSDKQIFSINRNKKTIKNFSNTCRVKIFIYICNAFARVAQLVEHDLAKVGVAGSNPVSRSHRSLGGGIGRHAGLKILWTLVRAGSIPARGTQRIKDEFLFVFFYAVFRNILYFRFVSNCK